MPTLRFAQGQRTRRPLDCESFGLYASPGYRAKLKGGQEPALIGYDRDSNFIFTSAWLERQFRGDHFVFRATSQMSQAAAARAGYGIAMLPRYLTASDRGLVPVLLDEHLPERDVWLLIRRVSLRSHVSERWPIISWKYFSAIAAFSSQVPDHPHSNVGKYPRLERVAFERERREGFMARPP